MYKKAVRVLAVFLAALMGLSVFQTTLSASAVNDSSNSSPEIEQLGALENLDVCPTIILPGISQSISYYDENDNGELDAGELNGGLMYIDTSNLVWKILKTVFFPLLFTLIFQREMLSFTDKMYELACDLFEIQASDNNGNVVKNTKTITYKDSVADMSEDDRDRFYRLMPMQPLTERIGEENTYLFAFPLLGNPMANAAALQDYIDYVQEKHNGSKVNLAAISLGGTVLTAWLDYEGADYNDINKVINAVSLLDGSTIMSDLMARGVQGFNLEDSYIYDEFVPTVMEGVANDSSMGFLINIVLRLFPRKVLEKTLTRTLDGVLDTFVLNSPQFWAMVPSGKPDAFGNVVYENTYPELVERYMNPENNPEKAVLREKTDRFYQAQLNLEDNLNNLAAAGATVYNVSGYNLGYDVEDYSFFGIVASSKTVSSDGIIPVQSTSLGATAAAANQQLSEEYLSTRDPKYISPDKGLDASTCLFPDTSWFFYNQHHEIGRSDLIVKLCTAILTDDIENIDSDPNFPQFNVGRKTNSLSGRIRDAEGLFEQPEDIAEGKEQALRDAYAEALALLATPIGDPAETQRVTQLLTKAIAEAKGQEYATSTEKELSFGEVIVNLINKTLNRFIGYQGISDKYYFYKK